MRGALTVACVAAIAAATQLEAATDALGQGAKPKQCMRTAERAKKELPDFYAILKAGKEWTDPEFPPNNFAMYWEDANERKDEKAGSNIEINDVIEFWQEIKRALNRPWARAYGWSADACLLGKDGVAHYQMMTQGALGDCWFVSAMNAFAAKEGKLERVLVNAENKLNAAGIHAFKFWALGVPRPVVVDDKLPLGPAEDGKKLQFAPPGKDGSWWGALLEKALAKHWGNYLHVIGGEPHNGVRTVQGGPSVVHYVKDAKTPAQQEAIWKAVVKGTKDGATMHHATLGTGSRKQNAMGLPEDHSQGLLGAVTLKDGTRLLKLHEPWGTDTYTGPWNDKDPRWTDELRAEANALLGKAAPWVPNLKDGTFWMPWTESKANLGGTLGQCQDIAINYDVTGWYSDYFLRLGDDGTGTSKATTGGSVRHTLEVTSHVAQTVYIIGHSWAERAYPWDCIAAARAEVKSGSRNPFKLTLGSEDSESFQESTWTHGAYDLTPIKMAAGQTHTLNLEVDLRNPDTVLSTDWSVVAWAEKGAVSVTHKSGGLASQHWPALKGGKWYGGKRPPKGAKAVKKPADLKKDFAAWVKSGKAGEDYEGQKYGWGQRSAGGVNQVRLTNGGPGKLVWGVSLKDAEWKNIQHWHTDATGLSTANKFWSWDDEAPTADRSKACDASVGGRTMCYIATAAGASAGWIGGAGSEGVAGEPDVIPM